MRKVLIANRGEIAVRIARACRERGLGVVAIYAGPDATRAHVLGADDAVCLDLPASDAGGTPVEARPVSAYLSVDRVIDAARQSGADAIHPGYGFLSERPALAAACADAGLTFIGPSADVIARMGSKLEARRLMEAAGVPCVPGARPEDQSLDALRAAGTRVGFPLIVKASAGGGGKGMRVVERAEDLDEALGAARREAEAAFGDGTLYVERRIDGARHIEVQIIADDHGATLHLGERECSLQRRHQKVIEEAPSPVVSAALRARMGAAAVAAARAAGYRNAGTVEFLLEGDGDEAAFYFLEMNTRLQVEHPVTELVMGVDLVHLQLDVAEGRRLDFSQEALVPRGHAVECRVYAEAPAQGFLPQAGPVLRYHEPQGPGIRVDSGVREGDDITPDFDPLLAKLVTSAPTRALALARAAQALREFVILGLHTNIPYLLRVLLHPDVQAGRIDTGWLAAHHDPLVATPSADDLAALAAVAAQHRRLPRGEQRGGPIGSSRGPEALASPWVALGGWRG
ncbi:biotin carboxylase N-terminal domain-containing protein [Luteitalea sp.]|uniref:acetyl-CoA carboxylase biotin carboxylase subunit n=1 Tax=Luteitalea sp. TaxID=2004800 RepID=UPI000B2240A1|nr:biotin carboxylase N-terminal domain-containing protein [Luteitalea sp.]